MRRLPLAYKNLSKEKNHLSRQCWGLKKHNDILNFLCSCNKQMLEVQQATILKIWAKFFFFLSLFFLFAIMKNFFFFLEMQSNWLLECLIFLFALECRVQWTNFWICRDHFTLPQSSLLPKNTLFAGKLVWIKKVSVVLDELIWTGFIDTS